MCKWNPVCDKWSIVLILVEDCAAAMDDVLEAVEDVDDDGVNDTVEVSIKPEFCEDIACESSAVIEDAIALWLALKF